ncbi:MAG: sugar kinase, partial [Planctomycetota bacterium]
MSQSPSPLDVLCFGETMIRFTPQLYERFQQTSLIEAHVGGSESNTAVGLSRLGLAVAWFSRLTDNPLGRKIEQAIAAHGVDTSTVAWTDHDRVGTYYMERGVEPRGSQVYYDRAASAMCFLSKEDFPSLLLDASQLRCLHTTGITLGISEQSRDVSLDILTQAKAAGVTISFDVNYRARLWEAKPAAETCAQVAKLADLIFIPRRDANNLYGIQGKKLQDCAQSLHELWPNATIALTAGAEGAAVISPEGKYVPQEAFLAEPVERLGGGDAFSAGFLSAWLKGMSLELSLRW